MGGSLLWWIGLSHVISSVRHKLDEARLQMINRVAGSALVIFGMALIGKVAVA
jgi:hypothetical protein